MEKPVCLITFAYKSHPVYNFIVVANRDEFFARPTLSAHHWDDFPAVYAGRDLEQGGTWLGLNATGKFTAVTNYRDGINPSVSKLSRGHLTKEFLTNTESSDLYTQKLKERAGEYGGFNLLLGDKGGLFYLSNSGGGYRNLTPGVYGLSNAHLDTPWPKVRQATGNLQEKLQTNTLEAAKLATTLHNPEPAKDSELPDTGISREWEKKLSSSFIRFDGYGTRCTSVILQKYNGETTFFEIVFNEHGETDESQATFAFDTIIGGR